MSEALKAESTLSKSYEPQAVERTIYQFWESNQLFKPENIPSPQGKFSLVIPPPNVTGVLHMGHALDSTIQDMLIRWHRMLGHKTLWMPGTDHAGIATQNVVERNLRAEGKSKDSLGREAFLEHVWEWVNARKGDIFEQFKRLGVSPDWERQRFTLDEGLSKAVRHAFVKLYKDDLIYQGTYVVNWCPRCTSAISDVETDYADEESALWEIAYPLSDGIGTIVVATTRPETMFGDVAVAVNPEDPRYKAFIGKTVTLPLTDRQIPVIADDYVDTAFGTGALKITPAHDPNDFKIGQAHGLTPLWILDIHGKLKAEPTVPAALHGADRFEARQKVETMLAEGGYLVRKLDHNHRVGHCQRCQTTIEPLLSKQWFVKTRPMADECLKALEKGKMRFIPERWTKDYVRWLTDIQDWCISRQLWWGHQIPAWNCNTCLKVTVSESDPTECSHCQSKDIQQDPDVLDTWFSSGLWPFSTMGWPDTNAQDYKDFYPTDVLVTGFDIIFFWVARMTMFGHYFTGQSPFHTVYIHGLIRDEKGQKMSKSKGNVVDPVELIDEIGCDGFRFGLASLITYGGQDIKLAKDKLELGRVFSNKLWNASRFVLMNLEAQQTDTGNFPAVDEQPIDVNLLSDMDRWILSRYNRTVEKVNVQFGEYRFGETADLLYEFVWNGFCDWYVEYAKKQLKDPALSANTKRVLLHVLTGTLKLLHPIMPYITEEIYQKLPHKDAKSIMISHFPQADTALIDEQLNEKTDFILETVRAIRNIRQEYNVPHQQGVQVMIESPEAMEREALLNGLPIIQHFVRVERLDVSDKPNSSNKQAGVNVVRHSRVMIPLEGLIDVKTEVDRLGKKRIALAKEQEQLYKMLSNFEFLEKAPPEVVEKNQARLNEIGQQLKVLDEQLQSLG